MEIKELKQLLNLSWNYETCSPEHKKNWNKQTPFIGQSAITSLIVNDFFSGKIMECKEGEEKHYFNLINNKIVDLTLEQFLSEIPQHKEYQEITREYLLKSKDTKNRYQKLLYNLKQSIRKIEGKKFKLIDCTGKEYLSSTPGTLGGNKKLKIYGKLDCPSAKRWIEKGKYISNRVFFENEEIAISAGYRPCSICMPNEYKEWKNNQNIKILILEKQ